MSEKQKVIISLLGALVAHLMLLISWAALPTLFSSEGMRADASTVTKSPRELTILLGSMDELIVPAMEEPAPESLTFVDTSSQREEENAPEGAKHESDRNTSARSLVSYNATRPRLDGPALHGEPSVPKLSLADQTYIDAPMIPERSVPSQGGANQPSAAIPSITSSQLPAENQNAQTSSPYPGFTVQDPSASAAAPSVKSQAKAPDVTVDSSADSASVGMSQGSVENGEMVQVHFRSEELQSVREGATDAIGDPSVDAIATPMGRYKKAVQDAIAEKWHRYRRDKADAVTWGILKIEFFVDPSGQVRDLEITKNEANAMLTDFSLRAIRDAELPPMPADVVASVGDRGLLIQYDIIIY